MARSLRNKLAYMTLCCTVASGMAVQAAPVLAENVLLEEITAVEGSEVQTTTGSGLTIGIENTEVVDTITHATGSVAEEKKDPWEQAVDEADYLGDIQVLQLTNDKDSMAAPFFMKEELPIHIRDGKVYLTVRIEKDVDFNGFTFKDPIDSLEQRVDNEYQNLKLNYLEDTNIRFITAEVCLDDIEQEIVLKCHVVPISSSPELRIKLSEDTVKKIKDELEKEESASVEDGAYLVDIDILHATNDEPSHSAGSFIGEDVKLIVEDGKGYLTLAVKRDLNAMKDVIGGLEQKVNGSYKSLDRIYTESSEERIVLAELELDDLDQLTLVKMDIQTPVFIHSAEVRIRIKEESLNALKQGEGIEITPVEMGVSHKEGSMTLSAEGGSGTYEYTIDGGENWTSQNSFEDLAEGNYKVAARDAENKMNLSKVEEVILGKKQNSSISDGNYLVDLEVLHETEDKESHAGSYFIKEDAALVVKEGKAYLTVKVKRDTKMGTQVIEDMIQGLEQNINGEFVPMELSHIEEQGERLAVGEIVLDSALETAYINTKTVIPGMGLKAHVVRIRLTEESMNDLTQGTAIRAVTISTTKTDVTNGLDGTITVTAAGGSGNFEYSIDGGKSWKKEATFSGLSAGIYEVAARDAENTSNISGIQQVTLVQRENSSNSSLSDGSYSVNIEVLQESSDEESMASQFFNKQGLPLEIKNGKAYLTVQVLKDGMGMKDVITSLEQKLDGSYTSLNLDYLSDSSKRYITAEVEFDSVDSEAYLRCGIAPMGGMKPVLRIRLDEDSIQAGAGSIDEGLKAETEVSISSVAAENGKVTITLSSTDETLTAEDFTGKIYLNNSTSGKALALKDFKMEDTTVTFTFDKLAQTEENQTVKVGITFNDAEIKSNEFTVKGSQAATEPVKEIGLKEDAKEIKYIVGYEDGTFRANNKVTKAETITMLADLINAPAVNYYSAKIDVLQGEKDEASMAKQFFKTEGITIKEQAGKYYVELEIANEGLGFTNIITGVKQKVNGSYKEVEVRKSSDLKTAYVTLEVADLLEAISLKTGISPMGSVMPELRIVIDKNTLKQTDYETGFNDIEMWAKEDIMLFESLGIIDSNENTFNPNQAITRGECIKFIALTAGLEINADNEHPFTDSVGHTYKAYIAAAHEAGLIKGYEDGSFRPDQTLTRAEAVAMINRFIGHDGSTHVNLENPFSDLKTSHWAYNEILKVVQA